MPPKQKSKKVSKKQMEKVARQQIYKMIPTKIHTNEAMDSKIQRNATPWLLIKPTNINWSDTNNYERASDSIFVEKCSGFFNLSLNASTTNRVEVRELMGFYKGSSDAAHLNAFTSTTLTTDLPNKLSTWDRDNYLIKHDKKYDLMPHQIYNVTGNNGTIVPNGIWKSKNIRLTLPLYRKYRYTNSVEGGNSQTVEGTFSANDLPVGWVPFIALQVRCPDQDFTGGTGTNAGPYVDYQFRTTFKDLQ